MNNSGKTSNCKIFLTTTAYVICFALFLWQCGVCVKHYFNHPIATLSSKRGDKMTQYPGISICNNHHRFMKSIENEVVKTNNITNETELASIWTKYGIHGDKLEIYKYCNGFSSYNLSRRESAFNSMFGQCTDIIIDCTVHLRSTRLYIRINKHEEIEVIKGFSNNKDSYFNIYAHTPGEINVHEIMDNIRAKWSSNDEIELTFGRKEYYYLNSPHKPCIPIEHHINCIEQCVVKRFEKNLKCKIPPISTQNLPPCTTWTDVQNVLKTYIQWQYYGFFNNCSCIRACKVVEYSLNYEVHHTKDFNESSIAVYFMDTLDDVINEYYAYPVTALISDLAGIFGFFLGLSLYGLFETVVLAGLKLISYFKHTYSNKK